MDLLRVGKGVMLPWKPLHHTEEGMNEGIAKNSTHKCHLYVESCFDGTSAIPLMGKL